MRIKVVTIVNDGDKGKGKIIVPNSKGVYKDAIELDSDNASAKIYGTDIKAALAGKTPIDCGPGLHYLWDNMIANPLDGELKNGMYGMWDGLSGVDNYPPHPDSYVGYCTIANFNADWINVEAYNIVNQKRWVNKYVSGAGWSGWKELIEFAVEDISSEFSYGSGATQKTGDVPLNVVKIGKSITLEAFINVLNGNSNTWFNIPSKYLGFYYSSAIQIGGAAYYLSTGQAYPLWVHNGIGVYMDAILPTGEARVKIQWLMP